MSFFEVQNHQVSTFAVLEASLMDKYSPFNPMYPLLLHQCYMKWLAVQLENQTSDWVLITARGLVPTWVITCCTNIRKLKFHKQTEKSWEQRVWISHRIWVQATECRVQRCSLEQEQRKSKCVHRPYELCGRAVQYLTKEIKKMMLPNWGKLETAVCIVKNGTNISEVCVICADFWMHTHLTWNVTTVESLCDKLVCPFQRWLTLLFLTSFVGTPLSGSVWKWLQDVCLWILTWKHKNSSSHLHQSKFVQVYYLYVFINWCCLKGFSDSLSFPYVLTLVFLLAFYITALQLIGWFYSTVTVIFSWH